MYDSENTDGDTFQGDETVDTAAASAEAVVVSSSVTLPILKLLAALSCASTEEHRYYLNGIFIHRDVELIRMVATDGHRLFVSSFHAPAPLPEWLDKGVILSSAGLKARLAMIRAEAISKDEPLCRIDYTPGGRVVLTDLFDTIAFRCPAVDGTFPDYNLVISGIDLTPSGEAEPLEHLSFNGAYLKGVGDLAKVLGADSVNFVKGHKDAAQVITFPGVADAALILMPLRVAQPVVATTVRLLGGAMKGTLAALKAHETRNRVVADDESVDEGVRNAHRAKADSFAERIRIILEGTTPALPAPTPAAEPEAAPEEPAAFTMADGIEGEIVSFTHAAGIDALVPLAIAGPEDEEEDREVEETEEHPDADAPPAIQEPPTDELPAAEETVAEETVAEKPAPKRRRGRQGDEERIAA